MKCNYIDSFGWKNRKGIKGFEMNLKTSIEQWYLNKFGTPLTIEQWAEINKPILLKNKCKGETVLCVECRFLRRCEEVIDTAQSPSGG